MSDDLDIELPRGQGVSARMGLPADARLDPDTALWVLEELTGSGTSP